MRTMNKLCTANSTNKRRLINTLALLTLIALLAGCSSNNWQTRNQPTTEAVQSALSEQPDLQLLSQQTPQQFSLARMPEDVRPCCAFGNAHKVKVGSVQVPFFRYANTLSLDEIGPHAYEAGTWSFQRGEPKGRRSGENNGQLYTLRGGFIDLAHVRDTADNTVALFQRIYPQLGQAFTIELPAEIGPREIRIKAFKVEHLSHQQRWELAAQLAARMAYSMAEAHEIAQWHGYRSWRPWSEEVSAYSPEDLYSNMLGAKIGLALVVNNLSMTRELYNQHMSQWLSASIAQLEPVSKQQTNAMFDAIDGHWWDSNQALPSKFMLLKRHYRLGKEQHPYLVPEQLAQQDANWPLLEPLFAKTASPMPLSLPAIVHGIDMGGVAQQWLEVAPKYQASFSHIPSHLWQNGFSNRKFLAISAYNQLQDELELQAHIGAQLND